VTSHEAHDKWLGEQPVRVLGSDLVRSKRQAL